MKVFTVLFFVIVFGSINVFAQISDRERGIELFNQKKYREAVEAFQKSIRTDGADVTSLFYLAQSYENLDKTKEAAENYTLCYRKGLVVAEKLLAEGLAKKQNKEIESYWKYVNEKAGVKIELALKSVERVKQIGNQKFLPDDLENSVLILNFFATAEIASDVWENAGNGATRKAKIIKKQPARFTKEARENRTSGEVYLYVMLLANGEIGFVLPKKTLPDGLTENAVEAARKIIFEPAVKNGEPVTTIYVFAYGFFI